MKSDGESSILALKKAINDGLPGCDVIFQESPVGDHATNGTIENAVKQIKGQVRVLVFAMQNHWGRKLPFNHLLISWVPRAAASVINRLRVDSSGRTGEERRTGRKWERSTVAFGERVRVRPIRVELKKEDLKPRMVEGLYLGHASRSATVLIMATQGVRRGTSLTRLDPVARWARQDDIVDMKGEPWNWAGAA
eukprot:1225336-Pyramimonas_sp.AAC.1